MSSWSFRAAAAVFALGATLIVFWLWIIFGAKLHEAANVWNGPSAPANTGEITVNVLPAPKSCPKDKPRDASCP